MNNVFTAKLLQNLRNKKSDKGFTLIELLVVVIIIGVLAAVALPNLLGQVGKARESEAKNMIGALNRAQQAYYTERSDFAGAGEINLLEIPTAGAEYYAFSVVADGVQFADGNDNPANGTRDYLGATAYNSVDRSLTTAICRAITAGAASDYVLDGAGADAPAAGVLATPAAGDTADCAGTNDETVR